MHSSIARIEQALKKRERVDFPRAASVRTLVAYQSACVATQQNREVAITPQGEFSSLPGHFPHFDPNRAARETEPQVIARMMKYIRVLAFGAKVVHGSDAQNYAGGFHYTELVLNEFALYLNARRGPFSLAGFTLLLNELEIMARDLPKGLKLVLGTVPVEATRGKLLNLLLGVECGNEPIIYPMAKHLSAPNDPCYPGMRCTNINSAFPLHVHYNYFVMQTEALFEEISSAQVTQQSLGDVLNLYKRIFPEAWRPIDFTLFCLQVNYCIQLNSFSPFEINYLIEMGEGALDKVADAYALYQRKAASSPVAILAGGPGVQVSGIVMSGLRSSQIWELMEICMDHGFGVAANKLDSVLQRAEKNLDSLLPVLAEQKVLSNTTYLQEGHLAANVIHSDAYYATTGSGIREARISADGRVMFSGSIPVENTTCFLDPMFGANTQIDIYQCRSVMPPKPVYFRWIIAINDRVRGLQARHHYRAQRLAEYTAINKDINAYLLWPVLKTLSEFDPVRDKKVVSYLSRSSQLMGNRAELIGHLQGFVFTCHFSVRPCMQEMLARLEVQIEHAVHQLQREEKDTQTLTLPVARSNTSNIASYRKKHLWSYIKKLEATFPFWDMPKDIRAKKDSAEGEIYALEGRPRAKRQR